jgi:uncharacterized membrane protein YgdD (TMEM256/DUF423 family)
LSRLRSDVLAAAAGAKLLAVGIAVGALGTHYLKQRLGPEHYATLQTAIQYQLVNALGLLALGAWLRGGEPRRGLRAVWLLIVGTALFSGSLYALLAGAPRWVGVLTPMGGIALIVGWCLVVCVIWQHRSEPG